jgi:hypothetical protein
METSLVRHFLAIQTNTDMDVKERKFCPLTENVTLYFYNHDMTQKNVRKTELAFTMYLYLVQ